MERFRTPAARRVVVAVASMLLALGLATLVVGLLEDRLRVPNAAATYLLAVVAIAVAFGITAAVATAVGAFLTYDFLFVSPTGALVVADPEEWLNLVLLLALGIVVGQLAGMQRSRAETAALRERQALTQYLVGRELATTTTARAALAALVEILRSEIDATRVWIGLGPGVAQERVAADSEPAERPVVAASYQVLQRAVDNERSSWVRVHDPRRPSAEPRDAQDACFRIRRRSAGPPGRGHARVLAAAADQIGQALERDRLAEEATSAEIARRSEAAKTALLDSVSHDLRTPLASIRAAAGSLMDPDLPLDGEARRERAASIDREAERLNRLVSNLLDMSRIEAGDLHARLEVFPLEDLVRATVERMAGQLDGRTVTISMPPDLPPAAVDAVFLDQVLTNLLENATRHTPPEAPIRVGAAIIGARTVRLCVEDGGPGVPPAFIERVFDKFYRVPDAPRPARRGSGLGLAVVRGLVEAMGGRVTARVGELGGLAIDVDLQAVPDSTAPTERGAPAEDVS
jgi:two-component system sensor histidine kinase KdpD